MMKTLSKLYPFLIGGFLLLLSCESHEPRVRKVKDVYVYRSEYIDAFLGSASIFLQNENLHQKHFEYRPEMQSLYMLEEKYWPYYKYENKIRIGHDEPYKTLSNSQIQAKILSANQGESIIGYKHISYLDKDETRILKIAYTVNEWSDSVSNEVVEGIGKIKFLKRDIGRDQCWIPKLIKNEVDIGPDYCVLSSYSNSIFIDEETNRPESKVDLFFEIAYVPNVKNLALQHRMKLFETQQDSYFGSLQSGRIDIGHIRSKDQRLQFNFLGMRSVTTEKELKQGVFWERNLYIPSSEKDIDSLTFSWSLMLDTIPEVFSSTAIGASPILESYNSEIEEE